MSPLSLDSIAHCALCALLLAACVRVCAEEIVEGADDDGQRDVPFIRPAAEPQSSLRLDEVQQALQGAAAIGQRTQARRAVHRRVVSRGPVLVLTVLRAASVVWLCRQM